MRESISAALRANLEHSEDRDEPPVTRIGALAAAPRFSSLLVRLKFGNDARAYMPALEILARRLSRRYGYGVRRKCADCALREWIVDGCRTCLGAGSTMFGNVKVSCHACAGTGKHRHSDWERAQTMGVSDAGRWAKLIGEAYRLIVSADGLAGLIVRQQLERD